METSVVKGKARIWSKATLSKTLTPFHGMLNTTILIVMIFAMLFGAGQEAVLKQEG